MVLTLGVLGSGIFGAAMIAVMNREQTSSPIQSGADFCSRFLFLLIVSLLNYLPMAALLLILANRFYGMPFPDRLGSLFVFVSLGLLAFCSIGNILAAVVNSMQEAQIIGQLFYMPMLLLGGATIPLTVMPNWLQVLTQYLPSTHYNTGVQSILRNHESIADNWPSAAALATTVVVEYF
jgi:ABC-2 type transport system permease protein